MATTISTNEVLIGSDYPMRLIIALDNAKRSVDVLMFDWRWYPFEPTSTVQLVNMAFARAVKRGVKIRALVNNLEIVSKLKEVGVDSRRFNSSDLLHSKLVLIDQELFFIGSHNFTKNAFQYNYEITCLINCPESMIKLSDYFNRLWSL